MSKRWMASLPRFRTPIILQRDKDGSASRVGNQATASRLARVLKAFSTTDAGDVDLPVVPAPATHTTPPGAYANGWTAWWPAPPDSTTGNYLIPDPPKIDRPVLPTRAAPILWEAYAEVGTNVWEARISAVYARVEWKPQTGKEKMSGPYELSVNMAALKMRPKIIETANIDTLDWNVIRVDDNTEWKLESIVPSFRRSEFVELMVERNRK